MSSVSPATAVVPGDRRSGRNSTASYRSSGRSSILKRRLSAVKVVRTWRVSVLPGLVMFLCTLALIFLSIFLLVLLISQGMFNRQVVTVNAQLAETFFWAPYDQSCMLTSAGLHSCGTATTSIIPTTPFAAMGTELAKLWNAELMEAGGMLFITSCVIGGTSNVGWTNLQLIAGYHGDSNVVIAMALESSGVRSSYDKFPECLPTAPQDVAGMAMLETTIRDHHADGLYFLTLYSDLDPTMTRFTYVNSDGTTQNLIANVKRMLITVDGKIEADSLGRDYIITSRPLGERYLVTGYCDTVVEELSELKESLGLTGWSQGKHSKLPIVPGWSCGHNVEHANEVIVTQVLASILSLWFIAGDVLITIEGLQGLLSGKPVLKYTVLSGLERRKWLLACIVVNSMPGLLYMDVSRIYYYSVNGFKIFSLSSVMVANFFTFGFIMMLSIVDTALGAVRSFHSCVGYSAPVFLASSIFWLSEAWCHDKLFMDAFNKFYSAPAFLAFTVNGAEWPSGSYVAEGTPPIVTFLLETIATAVGGSFALSIATSSIYRRLVHDEWLVSTTWCRNNSLLPTLHLPNLITALPLEPSNGIKIGNRTYCKPSTIALMGYATVVKYQKRSPTQECDSHEPATQVISIYALVPSMVVPSWVPSLGTIDQNQFTRTLGKHLAKATPVMHTRGSCVV